MGITIKRKLNEQIFFYTVYIHTIMLVQTNSFNTILHVLNVSRGIKEFKKSSLTCQSMQHFITPPFSL